MMTKWNVDHWKHDFTLHERELVELSMWNETG